MKVKLLVILLAITTIVFAADTTRYLEILSTQKANQDITITPTGTGTTILSTGLQVGDFTGNKALYTDASGNVLESADISDTELDFLNGVTSLLCGITDTCSLTNKTLVVSSNTITTAASGSIAATELNAAIAEIASEKLDTGTANELTVTGTAIGIADDAVLPGTGAVTVPAGSTAQQPGAPSAGMIRYNSDTLTFEGYTTSWGAIGGGTALESIYEVLNAETSTDMSDWSETMTNDPTMAINSTTPLKGDKDYKITFASTSAGEYILSPAVAVPPRSNEKEAANVNAIKLTCSYTDGTGTAADDELLLKMYDASNTSDIGGTVYVKAGTHEYLVEADLLDTSDSVKLKIEMNTGATVNGEILICDSITFDDDYMSVKAITSRQTLTYSEVSSSHVDRTGEIRFTSSLDDSDFVGDRIISIEDDPTNTRTKFVALKDCVVNMSFSANHTTATYSRIWKNGTIIAQGGDAYTATGVSDVSVEVSLSAGDFLTVGSAGTVGSNTILTYISLEAEADADHVVRGDDRYQAHFVGSIEWAPTTGCLWSATSTSWGSYGADVDCDDNARTVRGEAQETATTPGQFPRIVFPSLKAGTYKIQATNLYSATSSQAVFYRITDGTNNSEIHEVYNGGSTLIQSDAEFEMHYASDQTNVTFSMQGRVLATGSASIYAVEPGFKLSVYYYPPADEKVVPTLFALPTSKENRPAATIANNGTATITNKNVDFIQSVTRSALGEVDVVFKTGYFSVIPAIVPGLDTAAIGGKSIEIVNVSTTGFKVYTFNHAGTASDNDFSFEAIKLGADYTSPGVWAGVVSSIRSARITYETASAVDGGTATSGSWQTRPLSHSYGSLPITLSSSQITLPKGEYLLFAFANFFATNSSQIAWYSVDDTAYDNYSQAAWVGGSSVGVPAVINGYRFKLDTPETFELRSRVAVTKATSGMGVGHGFGNKNIHTEILVLQINGN